MRSIEEEQENIPNQEDKQTPEFGMKDGKDRVKDLMRTENN